MRHLFAVALLVVGCDADPTPADASAAGSDAGAPADGGGLDASTGVDAGPPECVGAVHCDPRWIDELPYLDGDDTSRADAVAAIDRYGCAPRTDESGAEVVYAVDIETVGVLGAAVRTIVDGVDVDVHLLSGPSPETDCLARGDRAANALVEPGRHYIVVDTWVDPDVGPLPGTYELEVRFRPVPTIDCTYAPRDLSMFWSSCAPGIDCTESSSGVYAHTPLTGPVVLEAHLVTTEDPFAGWPTSARDQLDAHYRVSQEATDYVMDRDQVWAPFGEGGSMWGQGATGGRVPIEDEAFYVNMYWRDRPARGERMLIRDPTSGLAVVVSAGWETGPGDNSRIGGATEEVHDYLGTSHLDALELGFLADDAAPLGPVRCRD
ncbi:MAG: hypothetical protein H6719_31935 [Sandaracinaceae bacterium]|nr:hypothetical protein [Sandaracinaceae bacterium]